MQTLKNIISIPLIFFVLCSCNADENSKNSDVSVNAKKAYNNVENVWYLNKTVIQGRTQGTTFTVKTSDDSLLTSPLEIRKLLNDFDLQLSGYIPNSTLSQFNSLDLNDTMDISSYQSFKSCYSISQDIYKKTKGYFDPSVHPLVKAWGFFKEMNDPPMKEEIDSILTFIGFENGKHHFLLDDFILIKKDTRFELDFNAIAQGLSVDYLAQMLDEKGQANYFIEIGGEIRVKGLNDDGKPWIIGIDQPADSNDGINNRELENYLSLNNRAVATSGNYRKFYEKEGKRYSHTLNPKTGYPVEHNLLSVTVISTTAAIADGYATAFMTMGVDKTLLFIQNNPDLDIDAYLLFENEDGRIERAYNDGFDKYIL